LKTVAYSLAGKRVFIAGHRGMVGTALMRRLQGHCELLTASHAELDLRDQRATHDWIARKSPQAMIVAAAKVGGILANATYPAQFLYDNLAIAANTIEGARLAGVEKLLFLGSSCIYPRMAPQPIVEESLLTGALEQTNEWYAIAKIAGLKMCEAYRRQYGCDFISAQPTNLYGPADNYDLNSSHVLPALLVKAHRAKLDGAAFLNVWGTGRPRREFLHVDDLADALVFLMENYSGEEHFNIGWGEDITIADLARLVCETVGFKGELRFEADKPDGTPRKLLDVSKLSALGWSARIPLREGIANAYDWFLKNQPASQKAIA
jgi:GDP-L-fucose synthase